MIKLKDKKGFTLIELLVVIAIIGILSSVVLASLSTARSKGNDAKVQGQLASVRNAAEIYYGTNGNYGTTTSACTGGMFADTTSGMANLVASANYPTGSTAVVCNSNGTAYAVGDTLSGTGNYWCVDSTGVSKKTGAALGAATNC